MDWTAVGAIGELAGAVAVVVSLLYVGRQVQQNTKAAQSATRQQFNAGIHEWMMGVASDADLAALFAKIHFDEWTRQDATPTERIQIGYALAGYVAQLQTAYFEARDGLMLWEELEGMYGPGSPLMQRPYWTSVWPILRTAFDPEFVAWFEERFDLAVTRLVDGSPGPPIDSGD